MMKKLLPVLLIAAIVLSGCTKDHIIGDDDNYGGRKVKVIDVDLSEEPYGIGVDKDNPELLARINEFIRQSQNDGTFDEIFSHYMGDGTPVAVSPGTIDESKDQLLVAATLDFEPFEYGEPDERYGIDMEIASKLADYLGKELVIVDTSFDTMFITVKQHKCDICISGITITESRKKDVDFSEPYFIAAQRLVVPADNTEFDDCKTSEEVEEILRSKDESTSIGVESLTTAEYYCEGSEEDGYPGFPTAVTGYNDMEIAMQSLADGDCDYVVGDNITVAIAANKVNGDSGK